MKYRTKAGLVVVLVPFTLAGLFFWVGLEMDEQRKQDAARRAAEPVVPPGVIQEYSPKREAWLREHFPTRPSTCPPCECKCVAPLPAEAP